MKKNQEHSKLALVLVLALLALSGVNSQAGSALDSLNNTANGSQHTGTTFDGSTTHGGTIDTYVN